jgi:hypothetical protein
MVKINQRNVIIINKFLSDSDPDRIYSYLQWPKRSCRFPNEGHGS